MPPKVKIGLLGNFGIGNLGNSATLDAMLLLLRRIAPEAEITCVCTNPKRVEHEHKVPALPLNLQSSSVWRMFTNLTYAARTVRTFDVLIIPGTGILTDYAAPPYGLPYKFFRWCAAARLLGVRVALVSVGAGPLHHEVTRWLIKGTAATARYRSYRNYYSKNFLRKLGLDTSADPVYPDLAFRLPVPPESRRTGGSQSLTVCVCVMLYHGWNAHRRADDSIYNAYRAGIKRFVLWLLDQGYRVRLAIGDEIDEIAISDLRHEILTERGSTPPNLLDNEKAESYRDVLRQIEDSDIVISSRFHNLIYAFVLGKPAISTGYADYHAELMHDVGLDRFFQNSESLDVERLISQFQELLMRRREYEANIRQAVCGARERLAQQDAVLAAFIAGKGPQKRRAQSDVELQRT